MKKMLLVVLALVLSVSMTFAGWEFDHVFAAYDLPVSDSYGMHGVAVDGAGNVWYSMYNYSTADLYAANGDTIAVYEVFATQPDGTPLSFSPINVLDFNGTLDTLVSSCRGMETADDGNILYSVGGKMYKINATTGAGIAMYDFPGVTGSLTCPAVAANGDIYLGTVGQGNPVKILNSDLTEKADAIASFSGAYTRSVAVSADGTDLYFGSTWNGIGIRHFHSDIPGVLPYDSASTIGGWQVDDTTFQSLWPEAVDLGPDGNLYAANTQIAFTNDVDHGSLYWVYGTDGTEKYSFGTAEGDSTAGGMYNGRGCAWSADGNTMYVADFGYNCLTVWTSTPDAIDSPVSIPSAFELNQNYPNPFNPNTNIPFTLEEEGMVKLIVYDVVGREVATLVNENMTSGTHVVSFSGADLSAGMYIYKISFNGEVSAKNMLLIK
jgi:hypothetical protein